MDADPGDLDPDCSGDDQWEQLGDEDQLPFAFEASDAFVVTSGMTGAVTFDVTADIRAFLGGQANQGWLIRRGDELEPGALELTSRESGDGPELLLEIDPSGAPPPAPQPQLTPIADTFIRLELPDQAQGYDADLRVRSILSRRSLLAFDQGAIEQTVAGGALTSARLELTIVGTPEYWGSSGREIDLHRVTQPWSEVGATWSCAHDANIFNFSPDCSGDSAWEMTPWFGGGPWEGTPTDSTLMANDQSGVVSFDASSQLLT